MQYYMHDGSKAFRLMLAGAIDAEGARELERAWRTASSVLGARAFLVDLSHVTSADAAARGLLAQWHESGARLIGRSIHAMVLIADVTGKAFDAYSGASRSHLPRSP